MTTTAPDPAATPPWQAVFDALRATARARGLDLAAAGTIAPFNRSVDASWRLPDLGRPDALVILLGNSAALWPTLRAAVAARPALAAHPHPLDAWTVETVTALCAAHVPRRHALRFPFEGPPRQVAFQRLADALGFAQLGPAGLCVDLDHGPWLALRAAIVVDLPGPAAAPAGPRPCDTCAARPCVPALARAVAAGFDADPLAFVAVRDACPLGRAARYSDAQIRYHYLKDRAALAPDAPSSPSDPPPPR